MSDSFWLNTLDWITDPSFYIAVLGPLFMSLLCLGLHRAQSVRFKPTPLIVLFVVGTVFSALTAQWEEDGLHVFAATGVGMTFVCIAFRTSPWLVYPMTFFSALVVDLILAINHPSYPYGVGGAGFGDALFVMPVFLTLATIGANRLSDTTLTRPVWVAQMKPVFLRT